MNLEIPKLPSVKDITEKLSQLQEGAFETAKGLFNWIGNLFTAEDPEKGGKGIWQKLKEKLFGPALGVLSFISSIGKEEKETETPEPKAETAYDLGQLRQTVEQTDIAEKTAQSPDTKETLLIGTKILKAVEWAIKTKIKGQHCWDWAAQVYEKAGYMTGKDKARKPKTKIIFDSVQEHGLNSASFPADDQMLDKIKPGDWLYVHNDNELDPNSNHSVIFIEWMGDPKNRIAKVAACPFTNQAGKIYAHLEIKTTPVVYISRPA